MTDTRTRLLDAARRCIAAKGLAATTSRDITATANANLAAITYHFGSKEELVAQALHQGLRDWLRPALDVLTGDGDPATRAVRTIETLLRTFEEQRDDALGHLQALVEAPRIEQLHLGLSELWSELRAVLADEIRSMQAGGQLDDWIRPEAMAGLIVAVATGLVLQVTVDPHSPPLEEMAAQFGSLLLAARSPNPPT